MIMEIDFGDKISSLFSRPEGELIYNKAKKYIEKYSLESKISEGVLVGFSGGPDSVMLLLFLCEYKRRTTDFPLLALHVNHQIRDKEAERDETFAKNFSEALGVEFISKSFDVPKIASESRKGIEEAARDVRYSCFSDIIQGRNDISTIAVAHNSTDNLETVILNITRGAGSRGASGIPPVRDNIIRPLIEVSKREIVSALSSAEIPYVIDSTNSDNKYNRNSIRNGVIPILERINPSVESAFTRLSDNLREDDDCLSMLAEQFILEHKVITNYELRSLHRAVYSRVLSRLSCNSVSSAQSSKIFELLSSDNFSYSIMNGKIFCVERGIVSVRDKESWEEYSYCCDVKIGFNKIEELGIDVYLGDSPIDKTSLNIYKKSIQASLSSAIIDGAMYFRPKKDGDTIFYGGMTRKLKKLFSDKKIPVSKRALIPVLCDSKGPVWLPGFGVRDDGASEQSSQGLFITIGVTESSSPFEVNFGSGFKKCITAVKPIKKGMEDT